jgi:hypothetical protein
MMLKNELKQSMSCLPNQYGRGWMPISSPGIATTVLRTEY